MDINKITGAKIQEIRSNLGFDAKKLSMESGIDKSTLSKIENGKVDITLVRLEQISNALKQPLHKFITGSGPIQINNDTSHSNINSQINYGDSSIKELLQLLVEKMDSKH